MAKNLKKKPVSKFLEKFDPKNMQKTCFMFNKIEELLLLLLVLYYLKGLKNDKFGFANLYFNQFNSRNSDSTMFSFSLYLFAQYEFKFQDDQM